LKKGGARITERDQQGNTALLLAAINRHSNWALDAVGRKASFTTCQWLLNHGGADIADANDGGETIWTLLAEMAFKICPLHEYVADWITARLRVYVLRGAPMAECMVRLRRPEHARVVEEGARLRAALPAYLVRRRALLNAHCPLIAPLLALVCRYAPEPTTTKGLWATGLGVAP
jgi:hypothetical protein